jgi:luciferase family oxidoreductase group 1
MKMTRLSILDTCPIVQGEDIPTALGKALELAQAAERLGFHRYWISEHHNMPGTVSSATAVIIGHLASGTSSIKLGSGGIMLPNHAPYVVAEQFGTLAALHPGRIDLGLGRSPGTDGNTLMALRRSPQAADRFPQDLNELRFFLGEAAPSQAVRAIPGAGADLPLWILGSSLASAALAAQQGLAFAYASHVSPGNLMEAIRIYRAEFRPGPQLSAPYVMPCIAVLAAETDEEARWHFSSTQRGMVNFFRGAMGPIQPPVDDIEALWRPEEKRIIEQMNTRTILGSAATVAEKLRAFVAETGADEVMITGNFHDRAARVHSLELIAGALG